MVKEYSKNNNERTHNIPNKRRKKILLKIGGTQNDEEINIGQVMLGLEHIYKECWGIVCSRK